MITDTGALQENERKWKGKRGEWPKYIQPYRARKRVERAFGIAHPITGAEKDQAVRLVVLANYFHEQIEGQYI